MTSPELDNLVRTGKLKREPPTASEIENRNLAEYEGLLAADERLVADMIDAGKAVLAALHAATGPTALP